MQRETRGFDKAGGLDGVFQSTPSMQRETVFDFVFNKFRKISIHSLYAEGDLIFIPLCYNVLISIHSLYAEGDSVMFSVVGFTVIDFNPLPLCRGRQRGVVFTSLDYYILCRISLFLASDV